LNGVLLDKLIDTQGVNKFSAFYGNRMFITVFTRACHDESSSQILTLFLEDPF